MEQKYNFIHSLLRSILISIIIKSVQEHVGWWETGTGNFMAHFL